MGRKGLEEEAILDEAAALIAEEGIEGFSLRGLARRLGVRSASLYNHVNSLDDLIARVARRAMDQMNEVLRRAVVDKKRTEAVQAFFCAYHAYAHDNPEMYQVVLSLPMMATDVAAQSSRPHPTSVSWLRSFFLSARSLRALYAQCSAWVCLIGTPGIPQSFRSSSRRKLSVCYRERL